MIGPGRKTWRGEKLVTPKFRTVRNCFWSAAFILAVVGASLAHGTNWPVPEAAKKMKNPVATSPAVLKAAGAIYVDKCAQCHGDTGKGDGPEAMMYSVKPANFSDVHMMGEMTDGEIFWKMSEGREPMPAFKKQLTEEQRWQLVHYVRAFAKPAEKKPAPTAAKKASEHKH